MPSCPVASAAPSEGDGTEARDQYPQHGSPPSVPGRLLAFQQVDLLSEIRVSYATQQN